MNVAGGASKEAEQERRRGRAGERENKLRGGRRRGEHSTASEVGILLLHEERASERGRVQSASTREQAKASAARRNSSTPLAMGLVSFPKVIMPALLGSCVLSYAFWDLARNRKIFGGTVPHTIKGSEWEKETNRKMDAWPREAAGPVVMNPISRQNYHKA